MSGRRETRYEPDVVTRVADLQGGRMLKPNLRYRSEARENTNAYLAAVERKAAGLGEPVGPDRSRLLAAALIVFATLGGVALLVGLFIMR